MSPSNHLTAETVSMAPATLEALQGSIAKWERVVREGVLGTQWTDCPLCKLFIDNKSCGGCPVAAATGESSCYSTPYVTYKHAYQNADDNGRDQNVIAAAQAELDFLKSLLPWQAP